MEEDGRESTAVPESVMDSVKRTLSDVEEAETHLTPFLVLSDAEVLADMQPLERAQSLLLLAKATSYLFTLKLRCSGVHPEYHAVKSEIERLNLYQDKLQKCIDLSKEPLRPSATLNYRAATRFIGHSLPNLTQEQKNRMREISRGEGRKMTYLERNSNKQKKRKHRSAERQSVQGAAKEFLEKAAKELLGGDNKGGGLPGPLQSHVVD